jgi:2-amino-4-hydroxy-6-hydroxymethyldihydropteridine diphosphokinase
MTTAVLALGANLGDRVAALRAAVTGLAEVGAVVAVSPLYESDPIGPAQPDYLNAVVLIDTERSPEQLLEAAHRLEAAASRQRAERWGPRTLDVDVIAYGAVVRADATLTLPHPEAERRAFVLVPWLDVDAEAELPDGRRVADVAAELSRDGLRRVAEEWTR